MDKSFTFQDLFKGSVLKMQPWSMLGIGDIGLRLAVSFLLGMLIFMIYKKTFRGVIYSQSFNVSIVTVTMVTSVIIMTISGNLIISLGMVGALSIVRFRMPIKDSMDIAFLFWAIAIGIANGIGYFKLSISSTIIISIILLAFNKKEKTDLPHLLTVTFTDLDDESRIIALIEEMAEKYRIRNTTFETSFNEICSEVRISSKVKSELMKAIKSVSSVNRAVLISHSGDLEPL